jgi:hypothetical protein
MSKYQLARMTRSRCSSVAAEVQHRALLCCCDKALMCLLIDPETPRIGAFELNDIHAEQVFELRVAVGRTAFNIPDQHGHRTAVEYRTQLFLADLERRLQLATLGDVAHRGTYAYPAALQARQARQADLHRKQTAVLAYPLQIVQAGTHLSSIAMGNEAVAQLDMAPVTSDRHQTLDSLAHQLASAVAEQPIQLLVGPQDAPVSPHYQHAVRCRLDDPAVPGLGGAQCRLLGFELLGLPLQLQRLFRHFIGLPTGFRQQYLDGLITFQDGHRCSQARGGLLK